MDSLLIGLNEEQVQAVTTTEGYVRVIAGAGSGKTKALTHRFAYLVNVLGIPPSNIMSVTFTNKAAGEMKNRILSLIGENDMGYISTFHGFCARFLRDEIHHLNYPSKYMIIDEEDKKSILREIIKDDLGLNLNDFRIKNIIDTIRSKKFTDNDYVNLVSNIDLNDLKNHEMLAGKTEEKIYYKYLLKQRKNYALDYDDLLIFTIKILSSFKSVLENWQSKLLYIQVDEFQDVTALEFTLVKLLSNKHKNLFVVGDPDQTIYTWRGANIGVILDFEKVFPESISINMNKNYRSSPEILKVANSLIKHNKERYERDLIPIRQNHTKPVFFHAESVEIEAKWVCERIIELVEKGINLNDIAILYRSHFISRSIEEGLINHKIQYRINNGVEFYARKEIKDALSYLRLIAYGDDISLLRVINSPKRNIGIVRTSLLKKVANKYGLSMLETLMLSLRQEIKLNDDLGMNFDFLEVRDKFIKTHIISFLELISSYSIQYKELTVSELLDAVLKETGYEQDLMTDANQDRIDNIAELKNSIQYYEDTAGEDVALDDYLAKIALYTDKESKDDKPSVKLMTIHNAKGIEYQYVFVCGMNEGIFPTYRANTSTKMEEERRLAYVAFTRAELGLFITDAYGYNHSNKSDRFPSRFIYNIDQELYDRSGLINDLLEKRAKAFIDIDEKRLKRLLKSVNVFKVGANVKHQHFGKGVIMEVLQQESMYSIRFDNYEQLRNISIGFSGLALIEDESP